MDKKRSYPGLVGKVLCARNLSTASVAPSTTYDSSFQNKDVIIIRGNNLTLLLSHLLHFTFDILQQHVVRLICATTSSSLVMLLLAG